MSMHLGEGTISSGATGTEVRQLQSILQGQGYNVGPVDGLFGPQTQAAVQAFQKLKGLVPDGIVGSLTWQALQGKAPAPALLPETRIVAPSPELGTLGTVALYGIGAVVVLAFLGGKR